MEHNLTRSVDYGVIVTGAGPLTPGTYHLTPDSNVPITDDERSVWRVLYCRRGLRQALSIREIGASTALSDRAVKGAVAGLITRHNVAVGSSRRTPCGYYLLDTAEELEATCRPLERQAIAMFRRIRALRGPRDARLRELLGQMELEARP